MLQELYALAPKKLPVLLLMGCTYYSLGMHHLSVLYNEEILAIDSGFAEAYSNLGTTFRALAQGQQSSIASWGQLVLATSRGYCSSLLPHGQPITQKDFYTIAERFYRQGLAIRPRYWDAAINLAGLLSAQGRYQEALDVYISLEMAVEKTAEANERFGNKEIHVAGEGGDRAYVFGLQTAEKSRLERLATKHAAKRPHKEGKPGWDNRESRKDLYYAKGNLSYVLSNVAAAKKEYLKALVVAGYDVASVLASCHSGVMPNPPVTPAQVVVDIANKKEPPISTTKPGSGSGSGGVAATSLMMQTLAKIYQDSGMTHFAVAFYYLSLSLHPVANSCNNLGILLSAHRLDEAIAWYEVGLKLDPNHPHVLTNLGSALKDRGLIAEGINCYKRAIQIQPDFYIALANLANVYKDQGKVDEAIGLYRRALTCKPDFVEAFCNYVNSLLFVCDWAERDENLARISLVVKEQLKAARRSNPVGIPTVLPFHTFTYSTLSAYQVREISRLNAERILWNVTSAPWFRGFPQRPAKITSHALAALPAASQNLETWSAFRNELQRFVSTAFHYPLPQPLPPAKDARLAIGYVSSDFKDHPLSHLMQSVFGMHDRSRFRVVCYALLPPDDSVYAKKIASECESFVDVSRMSIEETVDQIGRDGIQVLVNLNGYTKGGRNEIFAARPAPISMQFMGFAGTMGAGPVLDEVEEMGESGLDVIDGIDGDPDVAFFDTMRDRWIDYFVADEVALPRRTVVGEPRDVEFEQISNGASAPPGPDHKRRKATDSNRVYTENVVYLPNSYFVNDHRQGFRDLPDEEADAIMPGIGRAWVASGGRLEDGVSLPEDQWKAWTREQYLRTKMRQDLFPGIKEDTIVFANMNQSYKIDPQIFEVWLNILRRVPNSILWLLRFPPAAEKHLHGWAVAKAGEEVASRVVFTDVAPKHLHIHRGRIADLFLDTPECNAHTTAADILWSGTPLLTLPKYEFKMCSRVAASVAYATGKWNGEEGAGMRRELAMLGSEAAQRDVDAKAAMIAKVKAKFATGTTDLDWWSRAKAAKELRGGRGSRTEKLQDPDLLGHLMVAGSYKEYEDRAVRFGLGMRWIWKDISGVGTFSPPVGHTGPFFPNRESPTHILTPIGPLVTLRRRLFLTRDRMPLFDTARWVRDVEEGMLLCWERFEEGWAKVTKRNMEELVPLQKIGLDLPLATTGAAGTSNVPTAPLLRSRCLWIDDDDDDQTPSHL